MNQNKWNGLPVVIMGISGISKETKTIIDEINSLNYEKQFDLVGFVSENDEDIGKIILNSSVITSDANFGSISQKYQQLGVIIPIGTPKIKRRIFEKMKKYKNIVYPNIISPTAKIMDKDSVKIGIGNVICSGVVITEEVSIGNFNLINLNSTVGHEVNIGDYCVINPTTSISGCVKIENEVLCGAGCTIMQGIKIKKNSIIGLGAFVIKDVDENSVMICEPGRKMNNYSNDL